MERKHIYTNELQKTAKTLNAGDTILLSGIIYTARDAAHKRMFEALDHNLPLPFDLKGASIYYAGPTPAPTGMPIGSCGPTTAGRMDKFAPRLLDLGLTCMIGKGERSQEVVEAIVGAGALAAQCVKSLEVIGYDDLGCESVKRLEIDNFPLIVAIDSKGNNLFCRDSFEV